MRRLFVLFAAGALVCAVAATTAFALGNNTVNYTVKLKKSGKPSKAKPAKLRHKDRDARAGWAPARRNVQFG